MGNLLSAIGLILDLIGVLLIFKFGLSDKVRKWIFEGILVVGNGDDPKDTKNKKLNVLGLYLIVIGFILQLIGNVFVYDLLKSIFL